MTPINFKLLHIFIAVAETKNFRQASEALHRSQAAVSMQIRQLEEQVGVALFHRTTRRVELTAEGVKLLGFARRALAEWQNGLVEIRDAVDLQRGTLSFACIPTVAATLLPSILRDFQTRYPGISITLRELAAEDLLSCIRRREADFGIGVEIARSTEFDFAHLFEDPIYAIATSDYPFKRRNAVGLAELCKYPVLINSQSAALRNTIERALAAKDLRADVKFEMGHTHTITAMAVAGLGVGILPKIAVPPNLKKTMTSLPIISPVLSRSVAVVTLRGQSLSPAARALTETIHASVAKRTDL